MASDPPHLSEAEAVRARAAAVEPNEPFDGDPRVREPFGDDRDRIVADVARAAGVAFGPVAAEDSWRPLDLEPFLDGTHQPPAPTMLQRDDGACLIYPGEVTVLAAESGAGKSWLADVATAERLMAGSVVWYIDLEDGAASRVARLRALSVPADVIRDRFRYVAPFAPLTDDGAADLLAAIDRSRSELVVLDATTELMALHGLELNSNTDVAAFLARLPRPIAATGAAVLLLDHVTKETGSKAPTYALGGGHKRAGAAVTLGLKAVRPMAPGVDDALLRVAVAKDRHGGVLANAAAGKMPRPVADVHLTASDDGAAVSVRVTAPAASGDFRPTNLMAKVSGYVEANPGATWAEIREGVSGNTVAKNTARLLLIEEDYVTVKPDGRAHRHHHARVYTEHADPLSDRYEKPEGAS